ncbi:MAG: sigma-70 family RNA polymerase sigma factor [Thermoanaerobaculia bacterium]|nr:sigma-70 family RNA polymerase sigma factor [Thermoanaerobaculia bacterium]
MHHRFGIPDSETENLLHDIFTSLLRNGDSVHDAEKWLIGAACNRSRMYWRDELGPDFVKLSEDAGASPPFEQEIVLEQLLDQLPGRAREVLRLRYLEGFSGKELARHLGMSVEYAYVLVHRSLQLARAIAQGRET